jgi:hypothetical protein
MALIIGLLIFATLPVGRIVWLRWQRRPSRRTGGDANLLRPPSIRRDESGTTAVRILRSDDDMTRALERANANAARIAAARSTRRYARGLARPR